MTQKLPNATLEKNSNPDFKFFLFYSLFQQSLKLLPCLILFIGGIILLSLDIPGWSLILGLPAVQIGLIFLIFTFDNFARQRLGPDSLHLLHCSSCGKPTLAPIWQKEKICRECQKKLKRKTKEEKTG